MLLVLRSALEDLFVGYPFLSSCEERGCMDERAGIVILHAFGFTKSTRFCLMDTPFVFYLVFRVEE